jgi:hypothetical protein
MSSPNYVDYLVRQEQYKDLLREANRQRMVKVLGPRPRGYRQVARWSGTQVTKWSSTLKGYVSASSSRVAWTGTDDTQARLSPNRMANRNH